MGNGTTGEPRPICTTDSKPAGRRDWLAYGIGSEFVSLAPALKLTALAYLVVSSLTSGIQNSIFYEVCTSANTRRARKKRVLDARL